MNWTFSWRKRVLVVFYFINPLLTGSKYPLLTGYIGTYTSSKINDKSLNLEVVNKVNNLLIISTNKIFLLTMMIWSFCKINNSFIITYLCDPTSTHVVNEMKININHFNYLITTMLRWNYRKKHLLYQSVTKHSKLLKISK